MSNLYTRRLCLTPIGINDSSFLEALFSEKDIRKYYVLRDDHAQSIKLFTQYLVESTESQRGLTYVVRLLDSTPIGIVGGEVRRNMTGEIVWNVSYAIHSSYRCIGYATESLIAFTEHIQKYGIEKSVLDISDENEASKRIAQKAGYEYNKNTAHIDPKHMELGLLFHWEKIVVEFNRDVYFLKACSFYQNKNYQAAERFFQKALEQPQVPGSPNTDALCYSNMGMACSSYGNYEKAFRYLKKAQGLGLTNLSIERELNWLKNNIGLY